MRSRHTSTRTTGGDALVLVCALALLAATEAHAQTGAVTGTVRDVAGSPVANATVVVADTDIVAVTGDDGGYDLSLPVGSHRVIAAAAGFEATEQEITAASGEIVRVDFTLRRGLSQFGEQLVVIGSRSERTALETPVPVDVLSSADLEESGQTETSRMIQSLAPSFNFSTSAISDGTDIVRPSTLRSLGPDQTLVLVNQKRRHNSALVHVNGSIGRGTAGVDLNAIPSGAIDQVQILRDGAAAQYGSDAIAGVLDVQLKRTTGVTHVELSTGQHYEGDGEVMQASVNRGWTLRDEGYLNLTVEYRDRGATNRAGRDPRRIFNFLEQEPGQPPLTEGTPDPREATYDRLNHRYGDAESENLYLFVNSEVPLAGDWDLYLFGGVAARDGESGGFNRLPSESRTNTLIFPEGHLPLINTEVDDRSLALGTRKSFANWTVDASVSGGENEFNFFISNSANTSMGTDSPTSADAGTLSFGQTTLNLDLFGSRQWGGIPVHIAFGAEYREDAYEIEAGVPASFIDGGVADQFGGRAPAGIQVFPGFQPRNEVDETRDNVGVYGDLELELSDRFLLGVATRYEDYSDFGNNVSGKLAARYELTETFAVRGSASTGFRAPSLHQSHFNNISTQFVDVDGVLTPLEVGTFRVEDPVAQALGARPLEEETSVSYSLGFTTRPLSNLSVTADVFHIDIDDRIVISGRFEASNPRIAPLLAPFDVNAAQFFTNAIDTETEGVDLVVAYTVPFGERSSLSLTGAGNWNRTEIAGPVRTPPQLAGLGETLFDQIERIFVERGQPREHYNLAGRYAYGPWGVGLRLNKFGAVTSRESATDDASQQTFTSKWLADLDLSYRFTRGVKVTIGANNLFDEYPDENIARNSFNGIFIYPRRTAPFGFNGGYYYARLGLDL